MANTERPISFLKDDFKNPSSGVNPASLKESEHHVRAESFETALPGLSGEPIIPAPTKKVQKKRESLKSDLKLSCDSDGARTHDPQLRRLLL